MKFSSVLTAAAFGLLLSAGGIAAASAATPAQLRHERVETSYRITHQEHRITREVRHHRIGFVRATRLRLREHAIRAEEHRMVRHNHGHLTHVQAMRLNRQENAVSRRL